MDLSWIGKRNCTQEFRLVEFFILLIIKTRFCFIIVNLLVFSPFFHKRKQKAAHVFPFLFVFLLQLWDYLCRTWLGIQGGCRRCRKSHKNRGQKSNTGLVDRTLRDLHIHEIDGRLTVTKMRRRKDKGTDSFQLHFSLSYSFVSFFLYWTTQRNDSE